MHSPPPSPSTLSPHDKSNAAYGPYQFASWPWDQISCAVPRHTTLSGCHLEKPQGKRTEIVPCATTFGYAEGRAWRFTLAPSPLPSNHYFRKGQLVTRRSEARTRVRLFHPRRPG